MKYNLPSLLQKSIFRLCAIVTLFWFVSPSLYGQNQALIYAKALNNVAPLGGYVHARAVAVDGSGNIYTAGYFEFTADFDPGPGVANLVSKGAYNADIFVAKYDASGNFIYAKSVSGPALDRAYCMAVDASSNVYIAGIFSGTANFNPTGTATNLVSAGGTDIFLAKYDASGNLVYVKSMGGSSNDGANSLVLDASSNAYITGEFSSTADFDPGIGTVNLTSAGSNDIFLAKYDASGNYVYAKGMGSTGIDIGHGIAIDASSNAYITGQFTNTVDFDPGAGTVNFTSAGNNDIFLAKYDASGNYAYAKRIGNSANDIGYGIALDGSANAYLTGHFQGTTDFNPGGTAVNLTAVGNSDVFLAKYNASGNYVYAKGMGGTSIDMGFSIALDASNNAYITGEFSGTADFDPGAATVNLIGAGSYDIFLGKYDASGNYVYARSFGSTSLDIGYAIKLDASSNIYIAGQFQNTVDFDPGAGTVNLVSGSSENGFVAKYNNTAGYIWAGMQGSYLNTEFADQGRSIAVDASGNAYVTGHFQGTTDFDPGAGTVNLTNAGSNDIFLAKLDAAGNYLWAKVIGGTGDDMGYGIVLDGSNLYITGTFTGTVNFNPGGTAANLVSAGTKDIFLAKYDASGNYVWAKRIGGTGDDIGYAIDIDASFNTYITGYFNGSTDFDPGVGTVNLTSAGVNDIFLAKYDALGNYIYAKAMGGTGADIGYAITVDAANNAYLTGYYNGTADFDPGAVTVNLTSAGSSDIFLAKYDASGNFVFTKSIGSTGADIGYGIALNGSSDIHVTGQFAGTVDFNPGGTAASLISAGNADIFLAKYDASGNYAYAKRMGGTGNDIGYGITVDANSNAYITGQFLNTVDFDPGAGTANLISAGGFEIFMTRYDALGNYVTGRAIGSTGSDVGYSIAVDASYTVYITGAFTYTADFFPEGSSSSSILTATNVADVYIAAYNTGSIIPLRFETVAARAVKSGEAVEVNWSTSSQVDNAYFEVQRSGNGVHFEPVSRVSGCLSCSEVRQYTAMDDHPLLGTSFYRIKQVDIDGKASYSKTVSVNLAKSTLDALHIYPTVTSNAFTVKVQNKGVEKKAMIQILNAEGKLVQEQTISVRQGENRISYSLAGEVSGVYYVRIVSDDQTSLFSKIIKQ